MLQGILTNNIEMTEEEFDERFVYALDYVLASMAESPEVDVEKFYSVACMLENLRFFSPVLYGAIKKNEEQ